ncbi:SDR family oxidoreductase [Streptomyces roseolus]|uniref:SDR family oxidoreductase n=1 Tax=Streptomyces roseolus TaxID=67358 RepID=UPI003664C6D8
MPVRYSSAARYPGDCVSGSSYGSDRTPLGPDREHRQRQRPPRPDEPRRNSTLKAGLLSLSRSLARETGPIPVLPGAVQVEAENTIPAQHRVRPEDQMKRECVPRRGRPEDIAALVTFLVGPSGSFIMGHSVHVDGGWLLR